MRDWQPFFFLPLWVWLFVIPTALALFCALSPQVAGRLLRPFWPAADWLYQASGLVAAFFMVVILGLILGQMIARWTGQVFPGGTEFAGYAMACTSFFALAHALTHGAHIRVSIFLGLNAFTRLWLNALAMLISAITATYFARYAIKTTLLSEMLNDRTQGLDQVPESLLTAVAMLGTWPSDWPELWAHSGDQLVFTPLWLPQLAMSIGTVLLAVAIWDHLYRLLIERQSQIRAEAIG